MASPFFRQAWTLTAVWANMIGQGMMLSYTSCLLPALQDPESSIRADLHTASWIASSCGIAGIPGVLSSSYFMEVYGRKVAHILVMIPGTVGWLVLYFAHNIPIIMVGRILGGITAGATVFLGAIVVGEYSDPKYRGVFLNLKTASVCLGGTIVHILGYFVTWRTIALIAVVPHIIGILIIFTWPETPAWLASKGEFDKSRKSFRWMREKSEASSKELEELIKTQMEKLSRPIEKKSFADEVSTVFKKFTEKDFIIPISIVFVSFMILETSGRHIFPAYALQIVNEVSGNRSNSLYYTLGIDLIITASAVSSSILVKIMKRRTLLFCTGFAAFLVLMVACTYLTLAANNYISSDHTWIVIVIFVVYFILANLGCTPIPLALMGEVLPLRHRGLGSAFAGVLMSLCVMGSLQITPYLLYYLKVQGTFFVFGITMALALLILFFLLPETKDKTLQEIESYFNHGRYRDESKDKDELINVQLTNKGHDAKLLRSNSFDTSCIS